MVCAVLASSMFEGVGFGGIVGAVHTALMVSQGWAGLKSLVLKQVRGSAAEHIFFMCGSYLGS